MAVEAKKEIGTVADLQVILEKQLDDLGKSIDTKVADQLKKEMADYVSKHEEKRGFATGAGIQGNKTPEDANTRLGQWAKAIYCKEHGKDLTEAQTKALGETTGSTGGFLIPYEFRPELLKLVIEDQVVRSRARVVPMSSDTLIYPRIVDTTHATTIHGGVKGTWTAEATSLGTGDPAFGQMQLIAKKFSDYVLVSNELVMDSPISLPPLLGSLLREGLGFFEDVDMLTGTGAGKVKGISTSGALISRTRTSASHIVYDDITGMQTQLFPSSYKRAIWVCSPGALNDLLKLSIAVGTGGSAVMVTNYPGRTAADEFPMSIFGRPLVISEKMADLGTAFDIMVFDPTYYIIGDRQDLTLSTSEHVAFATDQTAFRITERLDGAPWITSTLTPNNGGSALSAFVSLAT